MRGAVVFLALLMECSCASRFERGLNLPDVMLWAWQRPEDLRFLDTRTTGVAYLAGTARISPNGWLRFEPRLQPLKIKPGTPMLAVVRVESPAQHAGVETAALLQSLSEIARTPGIRGLQVDFDARASERQFYLSLLNGLQARLSIPIGVTALASWCNGDRWLEQAKIAEAVPMFFRMGKDERHNMEITSPACSGSIGLSLDEAWPSHRPPTVNRVYLFSPRPWDANAYRSAIQRIGDWK